MELKNTVEMMLSSDYKERFKAEYFQLRNRTDGLRNMLEKYKNGTLGFTPSCSYQLLLDQLSHMSCYIVSLNDRAVIENIDLTEEEQNGK